MKHDWEYKKLGEIGTFQRGSGLSKKDLIEDGFPCILYGQIHTRFGVSTDKHLTCIPQELVSTAKIAHSGDLILAITSEDVEGSCKSTAWLGDYDIAVGSDTAIFHHQQNAKFIAYYTKTKDFFNKKSRYARGFKVTHISTKEIETIPIPVPPLPIQQQIVAELDKVSEIIEKKKQQVKELDTLAQSIFYDMFGDPVENEKGWEVRPLAENVEEMFLGPFGSALKVDSYVEKKDAFCMVYEQKHAIKAKMDFEDTHYITEEKYLSLQRFAVREGDFIMSCRGTIGKVYQLPKGAPLGIIHPSLMKIRIKNSYNSIFFKDLLIKVVSNENTNGNCVQMAITAKELGRKNIILPPLPLQQSFAQKVEAIEKQKELITASIKEAQLLFDARMDYWFGE